MIAAKDSIVIQFHEKDFLNAEVTNWPERHCELDQTPLAWRDLSEVEAGARVLRGESRLVLGIAGCGKSHFCKSLLRKLGAQGKNVDAMSRTHTASKTSRPA